jgi:hypothetical protein
MLRPDATRHLELISCRRSTIQQLTAVNSAQSRTDLGIAVAFVKCRRMAT